MGVAILAKWKVRQWTSRLSQVSAGAVTYERGIHLEITEEQTFRTTRALALGITGDKFL
jgi:hypothetical protein